MTPRTTPSDTPHCLFGFPIRSSPILFAASFGLFEPSRPERRLKNASCTATDWIGLDRSMDRSCLLTDDNARRSRVFVIRTRFGGLCLSFLDDVDDLAPPRPNSPHIELSRHHQSIFANIPRLSLGCRRLPYFVNPPSCS
jgi:hypothetical protein